MLKTVIYVFSAEITPQIQVRNTLRFLELTAARAAQPSAAPHVTPTFRYPAQGGTYRTPTRIKPLGTNSSFHPGALQKLLPNSSRAAEVTAWPELSLILVYEADSDFEFTMLIVKELTVPAMIRQDLNEMADSPPKHPSPSTGLDGVELKAGAETEPRGCASPTPAHSSFSFTAQRERQGSRLSKQASD